MHVGNPLRFICLVFLLTDLLQPASRCGHGPPLRPAIPYACPLLGNTSAVKDKAISPNIIKGSFTCDASSSTEVWAKSLCAASKVSNYHNGMARVDVTPPKFVWRCVHLALYLVIAILMAIVEYRTVHVT